MEEKMSKTTKMNKQEFLLNKPLLKEINDKKRVSQYDGGSTLSRAGDMITGRGYWLIFNRHFIAKFNYWPLSYNLLRIDHYYYV